MATRVMGILNVTPDSFSDGGQFLDPGVAIARGLQMAAQGASVIDVGGESTRPGAEPVSVDDELIRVIPVVKALSAQVPAGVAISIDTRRRLVAEAAVEAGASMINDVSATLYQVAASLEVEWVAMHMQGQPQTMQQDPYYQDVVTEVTTFLVERAQLARDVGVTRAWIDPGIGFGKSLVHNLALMKHLGDLVSTGFPVVLGASRKSFIGALSSNGPVSNSRLEGSLAAAVWAATCGVQMVRVHDVVETVRALRVANAIGEAA